MKKYIVLIVFLFFVSSAKASGYSIRFTNTTVRVPYRETAAQYMPKARVTFPSGASSVDPDTEYEYGVGEIKLTNLYSYQPGTYQVECTARSEKYDVFCSEIITVVIFDAIPPVIECDDIEISYGEKFDINNYAKAVDDVDRIMTLTTSKINLDEIGESEITLYTQDKEGNKQEKTIKLTIYDREKPKIKVKDRQLYVDEKFNLLDNIISVNDNYTKLNKNKVKIDRKKIGNNYYLITYHVEDESGNLTKEKVFLRYNNPGLPIISLVEKENQEGPFDPLNYVKAFDEQDGDLSDSIMVIETNIKEKYCIYEVHDSDGNYVRNKIYFDNLGNKRKLVFPMVDEAIQETNGNLIENKKSKTFLIYIGIGVVVISFSAFKIIRHFKKKNDIIKSE